MIWGDDRIMQMDAGLGVVAAILDLFLYEEQGVLEIFHGIPKDRKGVSCKELAAPGGIHFSGSDTCLRFRAVRDAELKFRFPAGRGTWRDSAGNIHAAGELFCTRMKAGEELRFDKQTNL